MTTDKLDAVTRFLQSQGFEPAVACFESSDFVIGWRIRTPEFELVYRVEADQLIVCDYQPAAGGQANGAVMAFIRFIHRIERHVPQLASVRGMFIEMLSDPVLTEARKRLARVLEAQGADWREIEGEAWLVYPMPVRKRREAVG
ncbi:secretion protein [Trinickia caryophylli]|uniref:Secretion system effector SseE n=1 Tax=Trinickia caryophylli TaxID=28094 RepID=A0A1X7EX37_TRICW|nr:hypothetical protein [Trinickia caryophylli]PMS09677.1 secretion protein [Trinickia caryophylli]TRX18447.1 secretion protein [Trinickia caryophylli]WQE10768.1 secretion protein [Trinickia caryophylli]SMF41859.1 hypothetical protein SAMN06295900_106400 [Trinickia caryophylli]